jgi:putative transport protein
MESFGAVLRNHPEIALFLTLAVGYLIGKIRVAGHDLGLVTGSLFAGLIVGQLGVDIGMEIKTIFLLLFLFANGYSAGPQFFQALRSDGVKPLILTLVICLSGLGVVWAMARVMGLDAGFAAGLLSGALTQSAAIGTASEAIMGLPLPLAERQALVNHIPIADAVCYLFGFWGEVFYVAAILPRLIGVDLAVAAKALEQELGLKPPAGGAASAYTPHAIRAFRLMPGCPYRGVAELEAAAIAGGARIFVLRIRHQDGRIEEAKGSCLLEAGDIAVLAGQRGRLTVFGETVGPEVDDADLLDIPVDRFDCMVTSAEASGSTLGELAANHGGVRGVFVARVTRGGQELPVNLGLLLNRGDIVSLVGLPELVERAGKVIGHSMKPSMVTDMFTLGIGIAVGCLIGLPALFIGSVKLSLSTAVGTLLAGLLFGWLRSWRPMLIGQIPEASVSFMISFGLAGFVAITGLHAGPVFLSALAEMGLPLFIAGVVCTCVPPTIGLFFGHYVLRMNPVLLFGAISGAQTMTAAMVAVQERAQSRAPVLGFTVPYALGNIILTTWGTIIVLLMTM